MQNINIFRVMEGRGVRINKEVVDQEIAYGEGRMNQLRRELNGYNPLSHKDLKTLLIDEMKLPILPDRLTPAGKPSFDKNAMKDYEAILENNPAYANGPWGSVASNILEYRGWHITLSLCYKKFSDLVGPDGRLRCDYWLHGTKTGRTSAHDPNLQQIPKDGNKIWNRNIKRAFEADEGYVLLQVDFSQGEMRLATRYAKQPNLTETFQWNRDMWGDMIAALNRPKAQCKTLTYAKMYGAQRNKLRLILGGDDPDQFITDWEAYHDRIVAFSNKVYEVAKKRGYVRYWTGRVRHLPDRRDARLAFNSLLQGGLAEIVKSAMIRLYNEVDNPECRMLLMVHDSVIFEIKREYLEQYITQIKQVMSRVEDEFETNVPFDVEEEMWGLDAA
ncbi:DNA polymerase [Streptomyces sp. NPDC012769]|uniref:DNA polymerase n=1 Tax=Streptomyces sp. NPDC012769 TaxID=3364848 RepID=UPI00369F5013